MWWITEFHVTSKILNLSLLPVFPTFNLKKKGTGNPSKLLINHMTLGLSGPVSLLGKMEIITYA